MTKLTRCEDAFLEELRNCEYDGMRTGRYMRLRTAESLQEKDIIYPVYDYVWYGTDEGYDPKDGPHRKPIWCLPVKGQELMEYM